MYKNILIPIDLNHDSSWKKALPMAIDLCRAFGSRLHVMTVVPNFGMSIVSQYFPANYEEKVTAKVMEALHDLIKKEVPEDIKVHHIVGEGNVYESILDVAEKIKADLVLMASHRPELKDYLLGPNAARVVRHAKCSVMVVRE